MQFFSSIDWVTYIHLQFNLGTYNPFLNSSPHLRVVIPSIDATCLFGIPTRHPYKSLNSWSNLRFPIMWFEAPASIIQAFFTCHSFAGILLLIVQHIHKNLPLLYAQSDQSSFIYICQCLHFSSNNWLDIIFFAQPCLCRVQNLMSLMVLYLWAFAFASCHGLSPHQSRYLKISKQPMILCLVRL